MGNEKVINTGEEDKRSEEEETVNLEDLEALETEYNNTKRLILMKLKEFEVK
jgi:hypothetical protein